MVGLVRFELARTIPELTVTQHERKVPKMKYTQKRTHEGQGIETIREKLSRLTPKDFRWVLTIGSDELCVSFWFLDDLRGCVEIRAKSWDGLSHRISAIDWFKMCGEVFADIERQEAFSAGKEGVGNERAI